MRPGVGIPGAVCNANPTLRAREVCVEIVVTGRNVEVPEHFRVHVADKVARLERYDHKIMGMEVELFHEPACSPPDCWHRHSQSAQVRTIFNTSDEGRARYSFIKPRIAPAAPRITTSRRTQCPTR